jgi:hypothetical protein
MKSISIENNTYYLLKCITLQNHTNIKDSIHEAVIDIAKKYNIRTSNPHKIHKMNHE